MFCNRLSHINKRFVSGKEVNLFALENNVHKCWITTRVEKSLCGWVAEAYKTIRLGIETFWTEGVNYRVRRSAFHWRLVADGESVRACVCDLPWRRVLRPVFASAVWASVLSLFTDSTSYNLSSKKNSCKRACVCVCSIHIPTVTIISGCVCLHTVLMSVVDTLSLSPPLLDCIKHESGNCPRSASLSNMYCFPAFILYKWESLYLHVICNQYSISLSAVLMFNVLCTFITRQKFSLMFIKLLFFINYDFGRLRTT